jgi:hypothetical protein
MKGKWAAGICPRNFTWVIRDRFAVSERPGGFAPNHRRVRRKEEIIWLRVQGFDRVISLLPSPHNLHAYDEGELVWAHYPLVPGTDPRPMLEQCFTDLRDALVRGDRVLMHQDELGDRLMGVVAAFMVWSGRIAAAPAAVATVERMMGRQMGPSGRELAVAVEGPAPQPAG